MQLKLQGNKHDRWVGDTSTQGPKGTNQNRNNNNNKRSVGHIVHSPVEPLPRVLQTIGRLAREQIAVRHVPQPGINKKEETDDTDIRRKQQKKKKRPSRVLKLFVHAPISSSPSKLAPSRNHRKRGMGSSLIASACSALIWMLKHTSPPNARK